MRMAMREAARGARAAVGRRTFLTSETRGRMRADFARFWRKEAYYWREGRWTDRAIIVYLYGAGASAVITFPIWMHILKGDLWPKAGISGWILAAEAGAFAAALTSLGWFITIPWICAIRGSDPEPE